MMNELKIVNRGKVAYLYMNDCFEQDIELIERNGKTQYAFVYEATDKVLSLLKEFDESNNLKKYNSCFKHVALAIKRKNMEYSADK